MAGRRAAGNSLGSTVVALCRNSANQRHLVCRGLQLPEVKIKNFSCLSFLWGVSELVSQNNCMRGGRGFPFHPGAFKQKERSRLSPSPAAWVDSACEEGPRVASETSWSPL